jgi:hypothetical protein
MRIPDKVKYLLVLCSGLLFFVTGCVDTSVQSIPSQIVYNSQVKFTNLVAGAGAATLTMNGQSIGTVGFGEETSDMTVQAGSKTLSVNYASASNQQYLFSTDTDYKLRVYLVGTASSNNVLKNLQRYIFQTPNVPQDTAQVTFFNGSPNVTFDGITLNGTDTTEVSFDSPLALGDASSMMLFKSGTYSVDVMYNDSLSTSFSSVNMGAMHRYTVVLYDTLGNLQLKPFTDD